MTRIVKGMLSVLASTAIAAAITSANPIRANADHSVDGGGYTLSIPYDSYTYRGRAIKPTVTVKNSDTGEVVPIKSSQISYFNNINVTGSSAYSAGVFVQDYGSIGFKVKPLNLSTTYAKVTIPYASYTYTGKAIKPKVTVEFKDGSPIDSSLYTVSYANNINVGTATITVKGKGGNVTGTRTMTFKVKPKAPVWQVSTGSNIGLVTLSWNKVSNAKQYQVQASTDKNFAKGKTTVRTVDSNSVSYHADTLIGDTTNSTFYFKVRAVVPVNGTYYYSNYSAVKTAVVHKDFSRAMAKPVKASYTYTGSKITPNVNVTYCGKTLVKGKDYTVTFPSGKEVGSHYIKLSGNPASGYVGDIYVGYTIVPKAMSIKSVTYDKNADKLTIKWNANSFMKYSASGSSATGHIFYKLNIKGSKGSANYSIWSGSTTSYTISKASEKFGTGDISAKISVQIRPGIGQDSEWGKTKYWYATNSSATASQLAFIRAINNIPYRIYGFKGSDSYGNWSAAVNSKIDTLAPEIVALRINLGSPSGAALNYLDGAQFKIYDSNKTYLSTQTVKNNCLIFTAEKVGVYYIECVKQPSGADFPTGMLAIDFTKTPEVNVNVN